MIRKIFLVLLCFVVGSFFFAGSAKAQEKKRDLVKVLFKPMIGQSLVMIANEEGFFQEEGIDVEFVRTTRSSESWLLMIGGGIDAMMSAPAAGLFNAAALNKDLKIVAGTNYLVAGNDADSFGIRKGADRNADISNLMKGLKGKKVGILQLGSFTDYMVSALLEKYGVGEKDVEQVVLPAPSMSQSLKAGVVDAALLTEPAGSVLRKKHGDEIAFVFLGNEFPETPYLFLFYGKKLLSKDTDLGVRFMRAFLKAAKQYQEGKTKRNVEIISKFTELDAETLALLPWNEIRPDGIYKSAKILDQYQDWLLERHHIDKKAPEASFMDTSFLESAKKTGK